MLKAKSILKNNNTIPKHIKRPTSFLCILLSCSAFVTPAKAMMSDNDWSDHDWAKLFYKSHMGTELGPKILTRLDNQSLNRAAQVSKNCQQLVDKVRFEHLDLEKQQLYSLILEVTSAEPNEVQWVHDRLERYLKNVQESGGQETDLWRALMALKPRLLQPESLIRANKSLVKNLLTTSDLQKTHAALNPLVKIIEDLHQFLKAKDSSPLNPFLLPVVCHYETYLNQLLSPTCDRAAHLHPKALLSGEGFLGNAKGFTSYRISQEMARSLLSKDEYGLLAKTNTQGSHAVSFKRSRTAGVHFKGNTTNTGLPVGRESAAYALSQILFGTSQATSRGGMSVSSLLILNEVEIKTPGEGTEVNKAFRQALMEGKTSEEFFDGNPLYEKEFTQKSPHHVLQAGSHVEGVSLEDFIEGVERGKYAYDDIDSNSFSEHIFLSMLLNPTDGTPGNFMLRRHLDGSHLDDSHQGKFSVVGIDNDMALEVGDTFVENVTSPFVPGQKMTSTQKHSVRVKNILICLPLMNKPLSSKVVKRILSLNPELMALQWLERLKEQNIRYDQLQRGNYNTSSLNQVRENYLSPAQVSDLHLPFLLDPDFIPHLCQTIRQTQAYLDDNRAATHWQLLLNIHPLSSRFYQEMVGQGNGSVMQAYLKIDPPKPGPGKPREVIPYLEDVLNLNEVLLNNKTVGEALKEVTARSDGTVKFTQTIHDAATQLLSITDLFHQPFLTSFLRPALESFGEFIQANPTSEFSPKLHASWFKNTLLHKAISERVSVSHLKKILELGLDVTVKDVERRTTLRYAIDQGTDPALLSLLKSFCPAEQLGSWVNTVGSDRLTALDIALEKKQIPAFKELMDYGASVCQSTIALKFYQTLIKATKDGSLKQSFLKLMGINDEVRWHVCLEEMLPNYKPGLQGTPLLTAKSLKRLLPEGIKDQILDHKNQWIPYTQEGNHMVCRATATNKTLNIEHSLYFKVYPELPGMEEAVGLLTRKLLGYGAPLTELVKIEGAPVLLSHSHGDKNKTLDFMLRHHPHILKNLDEESLSGLILVAMLINPEDGKPTNYVVEPHPLIPHKYRLVGIDNDHAFVPAIVSEKPDKEFWSGKLIPIAQVKTILYCLDQMKNPIHPDIRNLFINLRPDEILDEWLRELKRINASYNDLFPHSQEHITFFKDHQCFLGVPFQKGAISHLYDKFVTLRNNLSKNPKMTHLELLMALEPRLAKRYQLASSLPTVKERWDAVDAVFYEKTKTGSGTTLTRSGDILKSMNIPLEESVLESIRFGKALGPIQALEELNKSKEVLQIKTLEALGARAGDFNILKTLQVESTRSKFLENLDFKDLSLQEQEAVLSYLQGKQLRELILKNCSLFTDNWFIQNLGLKHLVKLDLRGCEQITYRSLVHLSKTALNLEELNLSNILSLKEIVVIGTFIDAPLIFNKLRFLNLGGCSSLVKLLIQAPNLHYLNVENCSLLTNLMLDEVIEGSKNLTKLCLTGAGKISGRSFREKHPTFTVKETKLSVIEQFYLGWNYANGKGGVLQDDVEAIKWYLKAAVRRNADAQVNLGNMYHKGRGVSKDDVEALKWYQKAAVQGHANAQYNLGLMYDNGNGVPQNYEEAAKWYRLAADQGDALAQYGLGMMYANGRGVPQDDREALKLYQKAADQGDTLAQYGLEMMYANGRGVPQDDREAVKWYQKTADQGHANAQANLGRMYKEGLGTEQNLALALSWIKKSAEQKSALGFYHLALMYRDGEGVERDDKQAITLLEKAVEQKHAESFYTLGWMIEHGRGVEVDLVKAQTCYNDAIQTHAEDALYSIGRIYEYGLGGETANLLEARRWYQKAADVHYEPAVDKLEGLEIKRLIKSGIYDFIM